MSSEPAHFKLTEGGAFMPTPFAQSHWGDDHLNGPAVVGLASFGSGLVTPITNPAAQIDFSSDSFPLKGLNYGSNSPQATCQHQPPQPRLGPSPGVAELFSEGCRGTGATLIGARVTGVRVTPTSGFSVGSGAGRVHCGWVSAGAESVSSGGGGGGGGGALIGVGSALLGAGWAPVDGCGATDVDSAGPVAGVPGLLGHTSRTSGTATAADAAAIIAIVACLVRYHGGGGDLNVNALLFEARS